LANNDLRMALELFSDSVRLIGNEVPSSRAPFLASLGLSLSCGGDMSKGIYALSHSIGIARGASAPFYELPSRLFLANAMLEMRRPRDAEFHLRIALRLHRIVSTGEQPYPSKILHLLGDALKMQRRSREAFDVFQRLQETFYPDQEGLAEILMDVDARSRITMW
ncbi:MAG: hypothetical protein MPN21_25515, partial [Thermoanaerobaculia bacterium]|nr:hypothetical protein [Thermoanaerobaculia bacterium]